MTFWFPPRDRERQVLLIEEHLLEAATLPVCEQLLPSAGGAANAVGRITCSAAVPTGVLLDALAA
ncbi:hypothetical protein Rruber_01419 [Rhodococcus ruber]